MVAFAEITEAYADSPPRARGQDRRHIFGDSLRDKPNESIEPRSTSYTGHARLGSCSRDPIGFWGSGVNLFRYVRSRPLDSVDPTGRIDKKAVCESYVNAQKFKRNGDLKKKCPTWTAPEIVCEDCNGDGSTTCKSKTQTKITLCFNSLPNDKIGARSVLKRWLDHEYFHAGDICECNKGCGIITPPFFSSGWPKFCEGIACLEIRAYSADGGCDHLSGDDRRECVKKGAIASMKGPFPKQCPNADAEKIVDNMMDKCYFEKPGAGAEPPDFPL